MPQPQDLILGEFRRTLDDRYRLSIPAELAEGLGNVDSADCILAKERLGCLSLWNAEVWRTKIDPHIDVVRSKLRADGLRDQIAQVQLLGRLLSTRHTPVQLAGRGRLLIPEGFREFLGVEPGGEVMVIGAATCIEIWQPSAWVKYLERRMPKFQRLLRQLST